MSASAKKASKASSLKITLVRSLIGRLPKHISIAHQLGLRKMHRTVIHQDNPAIRGLIRVIDYLLEVEECQA